MDKIIRTKVVKILTDTTVVLGVGTVHGVKQGTEFVIYHEGDEILDPETAESLGRLEFPKGHVVADTPQEKFCVAKTKWRKGSSLSSALFAPSLMNISRMLSEERPVRERLNVEAEDGEPEIDPVIHVGDPARSIPS